MCEWLSCRQWCDVYLLCGGQAFSAHRAVLASVSTFLKRVLLSCSEEDAPTCIVLPECDVDTMSSVLWYIYNGEVMIHNDQFETFMDTIHAMQIFIDSEYVSKYTAMGKKYEKSFQKKTIISMNQSQHSEIKHETSKKYINIKRGMQVHGPLNDMLLKEYWTNDDENNKLKSSLKDLNDNFVEYLKSLNKIRQRDLQETFSPDLLIETYSLNDRGNGVTKDMLAIPNELYREPTSFLLTNTNAEHPTKVSLLEKSGTKISENMFSYLFCQQRFLRKYSGRYGTKIENINYDHKSFNNFSVAANNDPGKKCHQYLQFIKPYYSKNYRLHDSTCNKNYCKESEVSNELYSSLSADRIITKSKEHSNYLRKSVILNEVTLSPWTPRLPDINYRPFRSKINGAVLYNTQSEEKNEQIKTFNHQNDKSIDISTFNTKDKQNDSQEKLVNLSLNRNDNYHQRNISTEVLADRRSGAPAVGDSVSRYTCTDCQKSFSQLRNFKYHMSVHRGTKEFATTCPVCGKYFNDRGYLSSHMKIHRNRKEYQCSQCPKSFNQRVAYNMHIRIHTGVKPHVCDECGKAFLRKMLLKQHQRTHSGERPYACAHCDKRFADRSNMTLHLRLHTGEKPFSCPMCSKAFTKKHHLQSHVNSHTGDKPYCCPHCQLAFTQSSNMRTHMKKCTAPRP